MKTDIYSIINEYHGDEQWEPDSVNEDYKEFKDYTYNVKMTLRDINYLLSLLNDYGRETNGAYGAKARFWKILLDSEVNIEVKEKIEPVKYRDKDGVEKKFDYHTERMFARPPFGCVKRRDKKECDINKERGCDICEFNCLEELQLTGKSAYANPNFVGFEDFIKDSEK
jgi:hypothetical protein